MSRVRSSMVLLGLCVVAMLIGALRLITDQIPLPTGSSYSARPDGALALFTWAEALGAQPTRLQDVAFSPAQVPDTLLILQPESPLDASARAAFDAVAERGGTLVVAGDSLPWLLYTRALGVTVDPIRGGTTRASTSEGDLALNVLARYRLSAPEASPLLVGPTGEWVGLRMPYRQGTLVVLSSPSLLTNAALRDESTARFVYRLFAQSFVESPAGLAFDEAHHSFAPPTAGPTTINQLLFETAPGRAAIYLALVAFGYLLLTGRRLGPALPASRPAETRRTMFEHVQMLADLYRRGGQVAAARSAFSRHYARELARGRLRSPRRAAALATALADIESARSEAALIAAVAAASNA